MQETESKWEMHNCSSRLSTQSLNCTGILHASGKW